MKTRRSARLIIIDPLDRVLFFEAGEAPLDGTHDVSSYWYLPGGEVEPGESFEEAARRELWEETGISGVELGPCVWIQEKVLRFPLSGIALAHERFFPVRVASTELTFVNMVGYEGSVLRAHRWWSADQLQSASDVIFPEGVANLIGPILQGALPTQPIRIN